MNIEFNNLNEIVQDKTEIMNVDIVINVINKLLFKLRLLYNNKLLSAFAFCSEYNFTFSRTMIIVKMV